MQVGVGAQLSDPPSCKLPVNGPPELLAIFEPGSAAGSRVIRRIGQIGERERSFGGGKALDFELQTAAARVVNRADAAHQVPRRAPAFERDEFSAIGEQERTRRNGNRIVARLDRDGLAAGFDEAMDGRKKGQLTCLVVANGSKSHQIGRKPPRWLSPASAIAAFHFIFCKL